MTAQPGLSRPAAQRRSHASALTAALTGLATLCLLAIPLQADTTTQDTFSAAVSATKAKEYARAADLFESLARTDDHDAQFNLALLLRAGEGRPQNFAQALEWALLAQLGGVARAQTLASELSGLTPQTVRNEIATQIGAHLQGRLDQGDRAAVTQYIAFNRTVREAPDQEQAYLWALIGSALRIPKTANIRDEIAGQFDTKTIAEIQAEALTLFETRNMTELFEPQPRAGS